VFKTTKRFSVSSKIYMRISTTIGFVHDHESILDVDEDNR